jgi:opacity protein-like surface antigen
MRTTAPLAAVAFGVLACAAPAVADDRVRLFLNGAFNPGSLDFAQVRTFTEFSEQGRIDSRYTAGKGLGAELGVHWTFSGHLGVAASVSFSSRDDAASLSAVFPHPLYLDRDRQASGTRDSLAYRETAGHLDLAYAHRSGSLQVSLFAGPSLVGVKADFVTGVPYTQAYPYDEVTVSGVDVGKSSDSAFGFNLGGGLDYRLSPRFGLGAQVRFTRATAKVAPAGGPTIEIDAGGFQAGLGVRVFFGGR